MKCRHGSRWAGALVIAALVAGTAVAQPPGGRGGFGGGRGQGNPLTLLAQEAVQKELGLSAETIEKGRKVLEEMREAGQAEMQKVFGEGGGGGFQNMTDEQRREMQAKMAAATQALQAKFAPQVKALLSEEQYSRLQQIGWQVAGAGALTDAEVAKKLGLSKEQSDKIAASNQEFQTKQMAMMREMMAARGGQGGQRPEGGAAGGGGEFFTKMQELNKERDAKALDVLTAEQKASFEKLKGKTFDVSQLQMGRGPGGPGGPGGGGRPGAGGRPGGGGRPGAGGRPGQPGGDAKK